ncbi:SsrA-binding protein SmpB [Candidatus Woesebacteria bacterium]|nr:MAG: SsrA-binding protein SmpB [Candidatus Woesebacteria bacterium]
MRVTNRRARYNYRLFDKYEAGVSLTGVEVKAIRNGRANISSAYAKIINSEIYLVNANIQAKGVKDYNPLRTRKLLLNKKEIISIQTKIKQKKLTLVPTKLYTRGRLIKIEIALAKTKRKFEKKEAIKKKDIEREIAKELKE